MTEIHTEEINLPTLTGDPLPVTLSYIVKSEPNAVPPYPFTFLHTVRSGSANLSGSLGGSPDAWSYYSKLGGILLGVKAWSESNQFDIAILAPSSRHDAEPFFAAIFNEQRNCKDYSPYFAKPLCFRAGEASALWKVMNAITSSLAKMPPNIQRVLIVDDLYSRGLTAAAIVHRLRTQGGLSLDARITVFTPAWIPKKR
jgi:hypothetical protein